MSTLFGSPALDFMYISASAPEAPPLSDTTIGCFIKLFFWIAACIIRAIWSDAPPAPAATTISTGLVGSHASAEPLSARAASPAVTSRIVILSSSRFAGAALGDFAGRRLGALREILHGGLHALLFHRNCSQRKAHFDAGKRAHQHEIVEVAEVADAEHLAAELGEPRAERQIERVEDHLAHAVGILAGRHHYPGERGRLLARIEREYLEAPPAHRAPRRFGMALVAGEYRLHALFVEHLQRLGEAVEQVRGRRVREVAVLAIGDHLVPRPVAARQPRRLGRGERLGRDAVE